MTDFSFGDVVLVPFPFTDQRSMKRRPAVVVSSEDYNRKRPDIVFMAVTSQTRPSGSYGEVVVNEWKDAGLLKPSVIKPIFATIEKEIVIRTIGRIQEKDAMVLREVLGKLLGR